MAASSEVMQIDSCSTDGDDDDEPSSHTSAQSDRPSPDLHWRDSLGHAGLHNQGATGYLNSLLQAIFHIGALRRAVYMIDTEKDDVQWSIVLALQRLFYRMQNTDRALSTRELTHAFRWDESDCHTQRDVHEMKQVFLEHLLAKMKSTPAEKADGHITKLFKGQMESVMKCVHLSYRSTRIEDFHDLSLVVGRAGCTDIYSSLDASVTSELLDGDNKYLVEGHGQQLATMQVRFVKFPAMLTLLLKRWDLDFSSFEVCKVNSLFKFDPVLDLSRYLDRTVNHESGIYHLHTVIVHDGTIKDGHYYAFVRPSLGKQWVKFDDECVSVVSEREAIDDNWGVGLAPDYDSGESAARGTNAYMLLYVRETESAAYMNDGCADVISDHIRSAFKSEPT